MRVALYEGKGNVKLTKAEIPVAGCNDIVIKNIYSSICGTDVAVYTKGPGLGHKIDIGGEFGHEMISEVVQVGENVKDIHVGDRVYPYPLLAKGDTRRAGTIGGFSEYLLMNIFPVVEFFDFYQCLLRFCSSFFLQNQVTIR